MKASEIQVGGWYVVSYVVVQCTEAKRGSYTFTPHDGSEPVTVTRASEVEPATPAQEVSAQFLAAQFGKLGSEPVVSEPVVSEPTTPEVSAAPHGWCEVEGGVVSELPPDEYGFEPRGASSLPPDTDFDGLADVPPANPLEVGRDELELNSATMAFHKQAFSVMAPVLDPLVVERGEVSAYSDDERNALQAEWQRLETALAEAPTSPPTVYGDDELATYEARWLAACSDTPPADSPLQGPCEVVPDVRRELSDMPSDYNFDGMGASDLPPRPAPRVERGQIRARAVRPRWARSQAKCRLQAGVR